MKNRTLWQKTLSLLTACAVIATSIPVSGLNVHAAETDGKTKVTLEDIRPLYNVDCGDFDVTTPPDGEAFGKYQSVTEQIYGADPVTGRTWGIVDNYEAAPPDANLEPSKDQGIRTNWTWAHENGGHSTSSPKTATNRYTKNQFESSSTFGSTRKLDYAFSLPAGTYQVELLCVDPWNNVSKEPSITLNEGKDNAVSYGSYTAGTIASKDITLTEEEELTVNLRGTKDNTKAVNIAYILITDKQYEGLYAASQNLGIASQIKKDFTLPTADGVSVSWASSNESAIRITDGQAIVTRTSEDQDVTLTATVSNDTCYIELPFTATVLKQQDASTVSTAGIQDIGTENITLGDAYLQNAAAKEISYLLSLSSEKFLYEFYRVAGLTPTTDKGYSGWERTDGSNFRGHTFGHYMSALSLSYRGSSNPQDKAKLLEQITLAVNGLEKCQNAYAKTYPQSAGYISAFPEGDLKKADGIESPTSASPKDLIVPYYNLHKVLAGLLDIYKNLGDTTANDDIRAQALEIASGFGTYLYNRMQKLTDKNKMLSVEYGGMNDALYELFNLTGDENFKKAAEYFDETTLFDQLAAGQDVLNGKHANTTIPKFISALKRYTVFTSNETYAEMLDNSEAEKLDSYLTAAENFWDIVVKDHTYITGGNSQSEHFHAAEKLYADAAGSDYGGSITCETCNTYNMLKLSRELFKVTKDKKYMDYYENTYINAILSSQNPETGTTMYFQPMASGYYKVFNRPFDEFWCCTGTGMENFSKLGDTMYFVDEDEKSVYVNMFFSNTYQCASRNMKITQTANMPADNTTVLKIEAADGNAVAEGTSLKLRIPDWAAGDVTVTVNGNPYPFTEDNGWAVISNVAAGDEIRYTIPMEVTYSATQDNSNFIAFKYGPVVLSCGLGKENMNSLANGILVRVSNRDEKAQTSVTVENMTVEEWKAGIKENLVRIEDSADGQVQFKLNNTDSGDLIYTPHYRRYNERYGLYMNFEVMDSADAQKRILQKKQIQREEEDRMDYLTNFDENNSEFALNMQSENSTVGEFNGRRFRHAEKNGWFSYDLTIDPNAESNYLSCTYYTGDKDRTFDLYINDTKWKTVTITDTAGKNVFYTETDRIPESYYTASKITVKFVGTTTTVGGLFGIGTSTRNAYDTNAALKSLTFSEGTLSPAFDGSKTDYTLSVSDITEELTMKAVPASASGLVYVNGILIDDTKDRTILLPEDRTFVRLITKAQDHETAEQYTIRIEKEGYQPIESEYAAAYDMSVVNGTLKDLSGNGNHAQLYGFTENDFITEEGENVLKFDGSKQKYAALPAGLISGESFTLETTFYSDANANHWLWSLGTTDDVYPNVKNYIFLNPSQPTSGTIRTGIKGESDEKLFQQGTITKGKYNTIVSVFENGVLTTYLNGELAGSVESSYKVQDILANGTKTTPGIMGYIGRSIYTNDPAFTGRVASFKIYDKALTAEDVKALTPDALAGKDTSMSNGEVTTEPEENKEIAAARKKLNAVLKTALEKEKDLSDYTAESIQTFQDAIKEARKVYKNAGASKTDLTDAADSLTAAMNSLKKKPQETINPDPSKPSDAEQAALAKAKEALQTKIDSTKSYAASAYTKDSYQKLTAAVDAAKQVLARTTATTTELQAAADAIDAAVKALKAVSKPPVSYVGKTVTISNYKYKITKQGKKTGEASFAGLKSTKKKVTSVNIKASVKYKGITFTITGITDNALKGNKKITKVTIGKNVKTIGKNAFYNCKKLKTIKFSGTKVKKIGKSAFLKISSRPKVTVPKSVKKKYKKLLTKKVITSKASVK